MPRAPRIELADAIHHVTARTPSRRLLFHDDEDRQRYLMLVASEAAERRWVVMSYCLMSNHVHLLLRTPEPDLGAGVKRMHERFAVRVNRRRGEHGHVFGSRFHNRIVLHDRHFAACLRYIARNPVAAGMCRRAAEWPWSAHRALAGLEPGPSFLRVHEALGLVGSSAEAGRATYRSSVAQPDAAVVAGLAEELDGDSWLPVVVDEHQVPVPTVAALRGWSRATTFRRLRAARETGGTGP